MTDDSRRTPEPFWWDKTSGYELQLEEVDVDGRRMLISGKAAFVIVAHDGRVADDDGVVHEESPHEGSCHPNGRCWRINWTIGGLSQVQGVACVTGEEVLGAFGGLKVCVASIYDAFTADSWIDGVFMREGPHLAIPGPNMSNSRRTTTLSMLVTDRIRESALMIVNSMRPITIKYAGQVYEVAATHCGADFIQLPDGTLLSIGSWDTQSDPPVPLDIVGINPPQARPVAQ